MKIRKKDNDYYRLNIGRLGEKTVFLQLDGTNEEEIKQMLYLFFSTLHNSGKHKHRITISVLQRKEKGGFDYQSRLSVKCDLTTEEFVGKLEEFIETNNN